MLDLKTNQWEQLNLKGCPSPRSGHRMVFPGFFILECSLLFVRMSTLHIPNVMVVKFWS